MVCHRILCGGYLKYQQQHHIRKKSISCFHLIRKERKKYRQLRCDKTKVTNLLLYQEQIKGAYRDPRLITYFSKCLERSNNVPVKSKKYIIYPKFWMVQYFLDHMYNTGKRIFQITYLPPFEHTRSKDYTQQPAACSNTCICPSAKGIQCECENNSISPCHDQYFQLQERRLKELQLETDIILGEKCSVHNSIGTFEMTKSSSPSNFLKLQEIARTVLTSTRQKLVPDDQQNPLISRLLHIIEDLCHESEFIIEERNRDRDDFQSQILIADRQLKATRKFVDEITAEHEHERNELISEMESLKKQLSDNYRSRVTDQELNEEMVQMKVQIRELIQSLKKAENEIYNLELDRTDSRQEILTLRGTITDLENEIQKRVKNEQLLKVKLQNFAEQMRNSSITKSPSLEKADQKLSFEKNGNLIDNAKVATVCETPASTISVVLFRSELETQLTDIEKSLDEKIKTLESLAHNENGSNSNSVGSEDLSVQVAKKNLLKNADTASPLMPQLQRIALRLAHHTRLEETVLKRVQDLNIQMQNLQSTLLKSEPNQKGLPTPKESQCMTALQTRLEDHELKMLKFQHNNSAHLKRRIDDLEYEIEELHKIIIDRDKQLLQLSEQLYVSKASLTNECIHSEFSKQNHSLNLTQINTKLMKNNIVVNRTEANGLEKTSKTYFKLPLLVDTLIKDKNEEIDLLKYQLQLKEKELVLLQQNFHQFHQFWIHHERKINEFASCFFESLDKCNAMGTFQGAYDLFHKSLNIASSEISRIFHFLEAYTCLIIQVKTFK